MQPIRNDGDGGGGEGGGGGGVGGAVRLGRFRSAPATWLETLLEEDDDDPLIRQNQNFTQLLTSGTGSISTVEPDGGLFEAGGSGFERQNSSPADFLGNSSSTSSTDGGNYFSSYGISSNYHYLSSSLEGSNSVKTELQLPSKEEQSGQGSSGVSGLMDEEMEKLLEESASFRVRAKRGCATHPRSIAERVRRTRISDRIRKLQELVPKMDKQTNTADMLDEAVEYVKFLQRQIQELTEQQRKCKCVAKE